MNRCRIRFRSRVKAAEKILGRKVTWNKPGIVMIRSKRELELFFGKPQMPKEVPSCLLKSWLATRKY